MKIKKIIMCLLLFSIFISIVSSKQFNYDEFKEKTFPKKIKYLIISFFNIIEQYTFYFLLDLNVRKISEPYDFFCCFIAGCILRIIFVIFKKIYKSMFNIKDNYIYNEPDNTENLYIVIKRLDELNKNLNNIINTNKEGNMEINNDNNLNENDNLKLREIEEKNININKKLIQLEKYVGIIEKNYNEEKANNEKILNTIYECQQFIKNSLESNKKEEH